MDHPIMADLKASRARAWERLRMLVGQWVFWRDVRNISDEVRASYRPQHEIQKEMLELLNLLTPDKELEVVAHSFDGLNHKAFLVKLQPNGMVSCESKPWVGTSVIEPIDPSIAPPVADRPADDDPTDLLRVLGG